MGFAWAGAAPIVKRAPPGAPVEVDGASWMGAAKGEEGAACPNPVLDAPNPVAGSPEVEPSGEAGWEPNPNPVLTAGKGALKENGEG